jgi:omega-hydroxy-beta-dihydromenaquinone-9 sulfotransferase
VSASRKIASLNPKQRLRLSLDAWRRLSRAVHAHGTSLPWNTRLRYGFNGAVHSFLFRIQDASHAEKIKAVAPLPPLFLLGFWRSGTTLLHELFCCDPRFGFPSTYACLNPSHFLLTEASVRKQRKGHEQTRRQMDDMRYSWVSPQEDEFALLALGAPSAYEVLIAPRLMRDARALLDLCRRPPAEQERWIEALRHFIQLLTVQQGKAMVLKSPPHGFRLPLLASAFPESRYVVIERNPYEVFASNLKLWRTLLEMYSLEPADHADIERFVIEAYLLHEEVLAEGARQLNPGALSRVRYEDLTVDPVRQMARLYSELGQPDFDKIRPRVEQYAAGVSGHQRNRFRLSKEQRKRVDSAWGEVIDRKGYLWSDEYVTVA